MSRKIKPKQLPPMKAKVELFVMKIEPIIKAVPTVARNGFVNLIFMTFIF